ncbi:NAD-dependent deacetylase [Nosocomiicoccus sp. HMSC059G07]|uniref:SIR2 family NAD-dependent protein deacylase n=1 Tax=Nosocomiicoccus sp. HMSC059G07 TaxID=1739531 RepID=UPI0008A5F02F|nr:NAD-dependent deacetylase [Nosocomiicoccus sp. HMSC059G07]OFO52425.1 deacetylase SIR2 [Nosocomiicoccus sp. HMSC059G07]
MSTWNYNTHSDSETLASLIKDADAVVVGVGAGMSASDGFTYVGDRFKKNFPDFIEKYGWFDMLQASLFDFPTTEEYWAFQSRFVKLNYIDQPVGKSYVALKEMLEHTPYFVITTNADNAFYKADYDMDKVFYYQGEYALMQCSQFCHNETYRDDEMMLKMVEQQQDMKVPYDLIPFCPKCNAKLEINKRNAEKGMVESPHFFEQKARYEAFLNEHKSGKVIYLEIGVGYTTPQFIKHPFWRFTRQNKDAKFVTMNQKSYRIPDDIKEQSIALTDDIQTTIVKANHILKEQQHVSN